MSIFDKLTEEEQAQLLDMVETVTRAVHMKVAGGRAYVLQPKMVQSMKELHDKIRPPYVLQGGKRIRIAEEKNDTHT